MDRGSHCSRSLSVADAKPLWDGDIEVCLSEFSPLASRDRDNLAKPIVEAMQGVAYLDDRQIKRLSVEWCDIDGAYVVRYMSPVAAAALSAGHEFIWIRVWGVAAREHLLR